MPAKDAKLYVTLSNSTFGLYINKNNTYIQEVIAEGYLDERGKPTPSAELFINGYYRQKRNMVFEIIKELKAFQKGFNMNAIVIQYDIIAKKTGITSSDPEYTRSAVEMIAKNLEKEFYLGQLA